VRKVVSSCVWEVLMERLWEKRKKMKNRMELCVVSNCSEASGL
jgi:hypothetical protein